MQRTPFPLNTHTTTAAMHLRFNSSVMSYKNVVAIPCPGRGHINPMLNLCKRMALCRPDDLIITFVVTEEWLGLIESERKPDNVRFATIPNFIPSAKEVGANYHAFINAIQTKMVGPVEQLLHRINADVLICDTQLVWGVDLGKRMDIPVASMFNMFATMFSIFYHYDLLVQYGHVGDNNFLEKAEDIIDYIPGVSRTRVADLGNLFHPNNAKKFLQSFLESMVAVPKAQFLIFVSIYELERQAIDVIRSNLSIPVYAIGPATVPYDDIKNDQDSPDYIKWLASQPESSVLYISQGSHLSVSSAQLDEIIAGVQDSGIPYMWIARGDDTSRFEHEKGLVIPWCDQLKVLSHSSVGAFWSHCGMNSTMEGAFSGVPMLTFPIGGDQFPNSKLIVEDWKMGSRVGGKMGGLVTREEIAKLITTFMDKENEEGKEMRKRAMEIKKICQQAISENGSAHTQIDSFISDILLKTDQ